MQNIYIIDHLKNLTFCDESDTRFEINIIKSIRNTEIVPFFKRFAR